MVKYRSDYNFIFVKLSTITEELYRDMVFRFEFFWLFKVECKEKVTGVWNEVTGGMVEI